MKTLNTYITEWKASSDNVSSIKKTPYFVYKLNEMGQIRIFDDDWPQFEEYEDKVYINGKNVELNDYGQTKEPYYSGTYEVEIKDINDITNCKSMFWNCTDLAKVPLFDTSKVENMYLMFYNCKKLEDVPLFDTSNVRSMHRMFCVCQNLKVVPKFNTKKVEDMNDMFYKCEMLNEQTKQIWSQVYNFDTNKKK